MLLYANAVRILRSDLWLVIYKLPFHTDVLPTTETDELKMAVGSHRRRR